MSTRLDGKVALVTGASRGIGRAIASCLADAGARVVLTATNEERLKKAADEMPGVEWQVLDVTDSEAVDRVISQTAHTLGSLDIVVNNAGVAARGPFLDMDDESWFRVLEVNLTGAFYVTRAAAQVMATGGRIINIASVVGVFGVANAASYVASKTGMLGLTRTAALELARRGITVNAICPGWTETDMTAESIASLAQIWSLDPERAREKIVREMIPMGRMLKPEEIGEAVVVLCAPAAGMLTAQTIRIDGGQTPFP